MRTSAFDHLQDLFAEFGAIELRAMFGGHGLYHDGHIIGIVLDDALYLKADAQTQATFAQAGGSACVYRSKGKPLTMSYWSLPAAAMESPQAMRPWAELAKAAALRKAASARPPRRKARPLR